MNQTRTACIVIKSSSLSPEELLQKDVDREAQAFRECLLNMRAGHLQIAAAIGKLLGVEEKK